MTRFAIAAAALAWSLIAASACDYMKSASTQTDPTVVASVEQKVLMSTPVTGTDTGKPNKAAVEEASE